MEAHLPATALRHRPRRWWPAVLIACLLAAVAIALLVPHGSPRAPVAAPPTTPVAAPPAVSTPAPAPPATRHDVVTAAVPTSFTLTGPRFTIRAHVCSMAAVFPLDPPGEQHHTVCWVRKGFGVMPGSDTATSYVLGHSWAEDDHEVLNEASEAATREILRVKPVTRAGVKIYRVRALDGYRLVLHTPAGTLTYVVRDAYGVAKNQLGLVKSTMDPTVRHRVVVITCAELHHVDYHYNVVIEAYLSSSRATDPSPA